MRTPNTAAHIKFLFSTNELTIVAKGLVKGGRGDEWGS